jgi:hypothetical protein
MKYLYQPNKWLVIINIILFIIPYLGLMFLVLLGASQVLMSIIIVSNYSKLERNIKAKFICYSFLSLIILITTKLSFNDRLYYNNTIFIIVMLISVILALLHLNITHQLYKTKK